MLFEAKVMDILFSCLNCIHNPAQSLSIGQGDGYCLQHGSVIEKPDDTTCKYLHRKDLPFFVVDEGVREHAAEFALFGGLVSLSTMQPVDRVTYSERYAWERRTYDPLTHAISQYQKAEPAWTFIQAFSAGLDGRRSLAHTSLVRRYMQNCGTWKSSYRLLLGLLRELDTEPLFSPDSLRDEFRPEEALWDVVFVRLSAIQEYGWHGGIEGMMWATDSLNGALVAFSWQELQPDLHQIQSQWIDTVIQHARAEGAFFPAPEPAGPPAS